MRVGFVFLVILMHASAHKAGPIQDVFQTLVDSMETLVFICEVLTDECLDLLKNDNPRLIVDIDLPIQGSLSGYSTYVICTDSITWLNSTLTKLKETSIWNASNSPRGKFFIISGNSNVARIGEVFWSHQITDVVLLHRQANISRGKKLLINNFSIGYEYGTYNYTVINQVVQIPRIDEITLLMPYPFPMLADSFFKAMYGVSNKSVQLIANVINATATCTFEKEWAKSLNSSRDTKLVLLVYNYYGPLILANGFDSSEGIFRDTLTWFLPRIKRINYSEAMISIFNWLTWILILYTLAIVILICWVLANFLKDERSLRDITSWYLIMVRLMFSTSCTILPRTSALRILVLFYIWYCIQLSNFFQANLTSFLTEPRSEKKIGSLEELSKSSIQLLAHQGVKNDYKFNSHNPFSMEIYNKIIGFLVLNTTTHLMEAANNNYGTAMGIDLFRHAYPQFAHKFYPLPYGGVSKLDQSIFIKKGHYFLKKLNFFSRAFDEGGFSYKLWSDLKWENVKYSDQVIEDGSLGLQHLQGIFLILMINYVLAVIVLIGEIVYYYRSKISFWVGQELEVAN